jgi:hypothetical protein
VLPWNDVSKLTKKSRINFSSLPHLQAKKDAKKRADVVEMIREYVGSDEQIKDMDLMVELFENGVPLEVAAASAPYQESDINHIYSGGEPEELQNGSPPGGTVKTALMVGTSRTVEEIARKEKNIDQSPNVLVQWWYNAYSINNYQPEIERIEVEKISEGRFVQRTYRGVSKMGKFDGNVTKISLIVDDEEFAPTTHIGRKTFKIDEWNKHEKNARTFWRHDVVSGTTLLNGVEQLLTFHKAEMSKIK